MMSFKNVGRKRLGRLTIVDAHEKTGAVKRKCQIKLGNSACREIKPRSKSPDEHFHDFSFSFSFSNDLLSAVDKVENDLGKNKCKVPSSYKEHADNESAVKYTGSKSTIGKPHVSNSELEKYKDGIESKMCVKQVSAIPVRDPPFMLDSLDDISFASPMEISTPHVLKPRVKSSGKRLFSKSPMPTTLEYNQNSKNISSMDSYITTTPKMSVSRVTRASAKKAQQDLSKKEIFSNISQSVTSDNATSDSTDGNRSYFFRSLFTENTSPVEVNKQLKQNIDNHSSAKVSVINQKSFVATKIKATKKTNNGELTEDRVELKSSVVINNSKLLEGQGSVEQSSITTDSVSPQVSSTSYTSPNRSSTSYQIKPALDVDQLALSSWGLPECVLRQYYSRGITHMFKWQAECLLNGNVLGGRNLIYSAPTSAGKTMVAELLVLKRVIETQKKAIIILPFVSVTREKMFYLQVSPRILILLESASKVTELYQDAGIRVSGFMGHYAPVGGFNNVDVAVCTIEKGNSLLNRLLEENKLDKLGIVVVDELHLIGDPHRGYLLELLLTKLSFMTRKHPETMQCASNGNSIQIVGMSATLPNFDLLANWLNAEVYHTDYRPVPLTECFKMGTAIYNSSLKFVRDIDVSYSVKGDDDHVVPLCIETIKEGHSILIFCPTKSWCEKLSETVARELYNLQKQYRVCVAGKENKKNFDDLAHINPSALHDIVEQLRRTPVGLDSVLGKTVPYGVAYHHAGLTFDERDIVEGAFRQGFLKVLVATSTLSSGVNLPARRVLIRTPMFHGQLIDFMSYKQMIGRAGRKGVDTAGESILLCKPNERPKAVQLMQSSLPAIHSSLACNQGEPLNSGMKRAVLEVVVSGVASTPEDVATYISCTLLATSMNKGGTQTDDLISECVQYLQDNEFVCLQKITDKDGVVIDHFVSTQLGSAVLASAISPDEGLIVFSELQRARQCFVLENELHIIYQVTPIYAQIDSIDWYQYFCIWESLPLGMKKVAELVGVQESFLAKSVHGSSTAKTTAQLQLLGIHKRFYTALVLHDLVNEVPFNDVCRKYNCNKGQLQSLQQSAATFAGMVTVFCAKLGWSNLELLLSQFQNRLTFGVQRELCDLVRISALNGQRARVLYNGGYQTVAALACAHPSHIEALLKKSAPFESNKKQDTETEWEVQERRKMRSIFLTGRKGVTEYEAAVSIINEAKSIIQEELGGMGVQWKTADAMTVPKVNLPVLTSPIAGGLKRVKSEQLRQIPKTTSRLSASPSTSTSRLIASPSTSKQGFTLLAKKDHSEVFEPECMPVEKILCQQVKLDEMDIIKQSSLPRVSMACLEDNTACVQQAQNTSDHGILTSKDGKHDMVNQESMCINKEFSAGHLPRITSDGSQDKMVTKKVSQKICETLNFDNVEYDTVTSITHLAGLSNHAQKDTKLQNVVLQINVNLQNYISEIDSHISESNEDGTNVKDNIMNAELMVVKDIIDVNSEKVKNQENTIHCTSNLDELGQLDKIIAQNNLLKSAIQDSMSINRECVSFGKNNLLLEPAQDQCMSEEIYQRNKCNSNDLKSDIIQPAEIQTKGHCKQHSKVEVGSIANECIDADFAASFVIDTQRAIQFCNKNVFLKENNVIARNMELNECKIKECIEEKRTNNMEINNSEDPNSLNTSNIDRNITDCDLPYKNKNISENQVTNFTAVDNYTKTLYNISNCNLEMEMSKNDMEMNISHDSHADVYNQSSDLIAASCYEHVSMSCDSKFGDSLMNYSFENIHIPYQSGQENIRIPYQSDQGKVHIPYESGQEKAFENANNINSFHKNDNVNIDINYVQVNRSSLGGFAKVASEDKQKGKSSIEILDDNQDIATEMAESFSSTFNAMISKETKLICDKDLVENFLGDSFTLSMMEKVLNESNEMKYANLINKPLVTKSNEMTLVNPINEPVIESRFNANEICSSKQHCDNNLNCFTSCMTLDLYGKMHDSKLIELSACDQFKIANACRESFTTSISPAKKCMPKSVASNVQSTCDHGENTETVGDKCVENTDFQLCKETTRNSDMNTSTGSDCVPPTPPDELASSMAPESYRISVQSPLGCLKGVSFSPRVKKCKPIPKKVGKNDNASNKTNSNKQIKVQDASKIIIVEQTRVNLKDTEEMKENTTPCNKTKTSSALSGSTSQYGKVSPLSHHHPSNIDIIAEEDDKNEHMVFDDKPDDKLSPLFIDPYVSGHSLTQSSFTIIDVCGDKRLFKTFILEWRTKTRYAISLACEKLQKEIPDGGIGAKFKKDSVNSIHRFGGIPLDQQALVIVGLAVSWENKDAFYISFTHDHPQGDPDDSLAPPPSDTDISILIRIKAVKSVLQQASCKKDLVTLVMFDMKSHYRALAEGLGFTPKGCIEDPKLACWLLNPGAQEKNLHSMVTNLLPTEVHMLHGIGGGIGVKSLGMNPHNPGSGRVRASTESVLVFHLGEYFKSCLEKESLYKTFCDVEMPAAVTLCKMELNGLGFSQEESENQKSILLAQLSALENQAYAIAGHPFSLSSSDDIAQVLFHELQLPPNGDPTTVPKTRTLASNARGRGKTKSHMSTSKEVLEKLKPFHMLPKIILQWRCITNALTKTVFPLQKEKVFCDWLSMYRIHGDCQLHTATGRVSMSEPNLQNVPKDFDITVTDQTDEYQPTSMAAPVSRHTQAGHLKHLVAKDTINNIEHTFSVSMRNAFIPFKGGVLLAADYSQLELRMIAHLANDEKLISMLNKDGDIFKLITAQWKSIKPEQVTADQRAQAKQICYGMIYGIGPKALAEQLDVEENDAAMFMETFKAKYPGMRSYLRTTVESCRDKGYVQTITGRKRYLESIKSPNPHASAHAERQAVNTTVQGSAADLVKTGMIMIDKRLEEMFPNTLYTHKHALSRNHASRQTQPPEGAFLVLQLHDELIYEVSQNHVAAVAKVVKYCLENAIKLSVKMSVKLKVGPSWGMLQDFEV